MSTNNPRPSQQTQDETKVVQYGSKNRKSMNNLQKKEIVRKWKDGLLETKPTMKGSFIQIIEDGKVTGCICIHCETYYIGNIGGTQRQHKCDNKAVLFSSKQKQKAKEASLKMVKIDSVPFSAINKPGFLEFAKNMLEIGAELGIKDAKNLSTDIVKDLLPHPTTLSNHINKLTTMKPQLYAVRKRKSNDFGISAAKHILSIPASNCPLERSFSVLSNVDSKERPQQNQENVTNIVLSNAIEKYIKDARPLQQTQDEPENAQYGPKKRKSMNNLQKKEIVRKWKDGLLETKPTMKGSFVQITGDGKVTGCICIHCETYFIGNIGGTQRQHKCDNS
uniref:Uncharacterized protein n=2 Tax=Panagrolaimus sp. PS1159 TaxID=55785 RepID=A0AC35GWL3_9BILA